MTRQLDIPTVEALWKQVQLLQAELEQQRGTRSDQRRVSTEQPEADAIRLPKQPGPHRLSRSRMLKAAAAGLAGVAAAEVAGTLGGETASADGTTDTHFIAEFGAAYPAFTMSSGPSSYPTGGFFVGQYTGVEARTDGSHTGDLAVYARARDTGDTTPPIPADGHPFSNIAVYGITNNAGAAIVGQTSDAAAPRTPVNVGVYGITSTGAGGIFEARDGSGNLGGGTGVAGNSGSGYGVTGYSASIAGIYGTSGAGDGVYGIGVKNGVVGQTGSPTDSGVWGNATGGGYGVSGSSVTGTGVWGQGGAGQTGVLGSTGDGNGYGIQGTCGAGGTGVYGTSVGGNGVHGQTSSAGSSGVWGQAVSGGYGVSGSSDTGVGVWGSSANRYGGQFSGVAPLYLVPNDYPGPPGTLGSGQYEKGAIYVDYYGSLYVCIASGNPGVWHRITSVVPITPVRVMNTRPGKQIGPYLGPIHSNTVLTLTLAGTNGIPGNATGVVGNLTAADATGSCFLAVVPSGVSHTGVSTINFPAQAQGTGVANAFMVGLSNSGKIDIYTGNCSSYTVNIIVDITGYIV